MDDLAIFFEGGGGGEERKVPNSSPQKKVDQSAQNARRTEFRHRCTKRRTLVPIGGFVSK